MDKTKVAVMQCESYGIDVLTRKLNEGMELLGGWERFVRPGMKVLLKPNLIGPHPPESAAVTHCEFVRAVTRILKKRGCEVWIGESAGGAINGRVQTARSLKVSGIEKVAEEEGAAVKNFDREGVVEAAAWEGEPMYLAKPMFDADFIINMPKFKTHILAAFTGAVKNIFGCVPGQKKAEYHKAAQSPKALGEVLCSINKALDVGLNIMDGVHAMDGMGPTGGSVYNAGKILISVDALAMDSVAIEMIGQRIEDQHFYEASIRESIGKYRPGDIEVCGDFTAPPELKGFKVARVFLKRAGNNGIFGRAIDMMKTRPRIDIGKCKQCNVCVGSCPVGAIDRETKRIDYEKCIECMCCHELCVYRAVEMVKANPVMRFFSRFGNKDG